MFWSTTSIHSFKCDIGILTNIVVILSLGVNAMQSKFLSEVKIITLM